jgi:hypothetical protein
MMSRTEAVEYLSRNYYIDEMDEGIFYNLMGILMHEPHKPWCRTRLKNVFANYGADCTCGEGVDGAA